MLRNCFAFYTDWCFARRYIFHDKYATMKSYVTVFSRLPSCGLCGSSFRCQSDAKHNLKTKPRKARSEEIYNYFQSKECLQNVISKIPTKIFKTRRKAPDSLYIVDDDVAAHIINNVSKEIKDDLNLPLIEINPGLGLLTKRLLKLGAQNLQLYEPNQDFKAYLQPVEEHNRNQVSIYLTDILDMVKFKFQDRMDNGDRVENIMKRIPMKSWNEGPAFRMIGTLPSFDFIKYMILSHILQSGLMMQGRPELFVTICPSLYHHLTCNSTDSYRHYRATTVVFQLIFDITLLSKVPRKAFLPWLYANKTKKKIDKFKAEDIEHMYLVKIVARKDFFDSVVPVEQLQPLWFFLRTHMMSRHNKIIPQLEQWIPGCGPRLIIKGSTIYDEFGDLNPLELLSLFKEFIAWPEYDQSNFISSMEANFMKMELMSDEVEHPSQYPNDGDAESEAVPHFETT